MTRIFTQNTVIFHTSCGNCGKGIDASPYGYCTKCSSAITKCCVWFVCLLPFPSQPLFNLSFPLSHLTVRSLYVFCATCGHGAHASCLEAFASSIATSLSTVSAPQTPLDFSHPSTPGISTPMQKWLWGEADEGGLGGEGNGADLGALAASNLRKLAASCPASCGHSPCLLMGS
ncbi:hypothetical protein JCM8547_002403 [Rhodosporidiobolus lusitaniae]